MQTKRPEADDLSATLERLRARAARAEARGRGAAPPPDRMCWALPAPGEKDAPAECSGEYHATVRPRPAINYSWECPAAKSRKWRATPGVAAELEKARVTAGPDEPLAGAILDALRPDVEVTVGYNGGEQEPAAVMVRTLRALVRSRWQPRRSVVMHGKVGTGKSHFQLCLFFTAVESGLDAVWLDEPTMQEVLAESRSQDVPTARAAKARIERWRRADAIFFNDVGFDDRPPLRDLPGRPLLSSLYWQLLEKSSFAVVASMNPHPTELCTHPDVGDRVVSRMLGRFSGGMPALIMKFDGEDQRLARVLAQRGERR